LANERRRDSRFQATGVATIVKWATHGRFRSRTHTAMASIVNLSVKGAGIMVESSHSLEIGTELELSLTGWRATATIRHIRAGETDGQLYYGIEFSHLDPEFGDFVTEYLATYLELTDPLE
jgi:hypothetical protein